MKKQTTFIRDTAWVYKIVNDQMKKKKKKKSLEGVPGGPVVRVQCFLCWGWVQSLGILPAVKILQPMCVWKKSSEFSRNKMKPQTKQLQ